MILYDTDTEAYRDSRIYYQSCLLHPFLKVMTAMRSLLSDRVSVTALLLVPPVQISFRLVSVSM